MDSNNARQTTGLTDQAETLREMMEKRGLRNSGVRSLSSTKPIRVISITSSKGGVGKTNVVANLAVSLQKKGHKVLLLDGDFGLANLNIVMGIEAKKNISDVLSGDASMQEIILNGPQGVQLIPASSGIFKMTQLSMVDKTLLTEKLESMPTDFDILLIDTGAGINSDVAYLNSAASEIIVVATPEPTSIADAYALMKVMNQDFKLKKFKLIVNMATSEKEALGVYHHLLMVSDRFLNISIEYIGSVAMDPTVSKAVKSRKVLCDGWPDSPAAKSFEQITESLTKKSVVKNMQNNLTGNMQFFWRSLLTEGVV